MDKQGLDFGASKIVFSTRGGLFSIIQQVIIIFLTLLFVALGQTNDVFYIPAFILCIPLLVDISHKFNYKLVLNNDGRLLVSSFDRPGRSGNKVNFVIDVMSIELTPEFAMPMKLNEGKQAFSTKPFRASSIRNLLRAIKKINPTVKLDEYSQQLLDTGSTRVHGKKTVRNMLTDTKRKGFWRTSIENWWLGN